MVAEELRTSPEPRCAGCSILSEPLRVGAPSICRLRQHPVTAPAETFCVNHPDLPGRRLRAPVGPVFAVGPERAIAYPSPDTRRIRGELIEMIAEYDPRHVEELGIREATAMWQLEQFGERRARAHLDRIRAGLADGVSGRDVFGGWLVGPSLAAARRSQRSDGKQTGFFERLTAPGKLLAMLSLMTAVWSAIELIDMLASGLRDPLALSSVVGSSIIVAAAGFLLAQTFGVELVVDSSRSGPGESGSEDT